ncbi:MAG: hypothetical protein H0T46_16700, partial [Deltaproteobacteria bacterium]|nr:hypothetical protein [Deltaproteobacteria bacterium]
AGAGAAGGAGGGAAGGGGAGGGAAGGGAGGAAGSSTSGGGGSTTPGGSGDPGTQPGSSEPAPEERIEPDEIEIRVTSASGEPVDGARYELTMPDGKVRSGYAGVDGVIKLTRLEQRGDCKIAFPEVDAKTPR